MNGINLATASDIKIGSTQASAVYLGANKIWPTQHDYSQDYFTFVSLENNNEINFIHAGNEPRTIQVSTDNGSTWINKTASSLGTLLATLNAGDKLLLKGNNSEYCPNDPNRFSSSKTFNIEGNIMSLIYGDNFVGQNTLPTARNFERIFSGCTGLINAENLILPATTLSYSCYKALFNGCTNLVTCPELPATTLATECYYAMFYNCTSLTAAPELPATTLTYTCYGWMFRGCTSLTTAPELPAPTLINDCYVRMFDGCTSLNYIKCLATDIWPGATSRWVNNIAATGTFVKDPNMNDWETGTSGIPSGWTIQNAS